MLTLAAVLTGVVVVIFALEVVVGLYIDLKLNDSHSSTNRLLNKKRVNERRRHTSVSGNPGGNSLVDPDYRRFHLSLREMERQEASQATQSGFT